MYDEIAKQIRAAAANRQKAVAIHAAVLTNAVALRDVPPLEFCRLVGIEPSWAVEFSKMLNLAKYLSQQGITLDRVPKD